MTENIRRLTLIRPTDGGILLKSLLLWIVFLSWTLFLGVFAGLAALTRLQNWVHVVATIWGRFITICSRVEVRRHNPEKLYRDGPVILLANHQGMFDIPVLYSALDIQIQFRWMAKASVFRVPVAGWAMTWAGYIPVERDNRKLALQSLFQAAEKIRAGSSVIIFPEGTWGHADGRMLPFKKGAFILAKKAGVVIQPITLKGSRNIAPEERGKSIQRFYAGAVDVHFHDPLHPEEFADLSPEQLSDKLRETIGGPL